MEQRQRFRIGDAFLGFVAATILANLCIGLAFKLGAGEFGQFVAGMCGLWFGLTASVVFVSRRRGTGSISYDFAFDVRGKDILPGLAIGLGCQVVLVPALYLLVGLFVDVSKLGDVAKNLIGNYGQGWNIVPLFIGLVFIAPVVEELFYRGQILRMFSSRLSARVAVFSSALVFAGFHFQLLQFIGLFLFGLVLAELAMRTKRLGLGLFAHIGFNAASLAIVLAS